MKNTNSKNNKKSISKIFIGLSLIILAVILAVTAFIIADFDYTKVFSLYSYKNTTCSADTTDIDSLNIDIKSKKIIFKTSSDEKINIKYSFNEHDYLEFSKADNKFAITSFRCKETHHFFEFDMNLNNDVIIELPTTFTKTIKINTTNSSIIATDFIFEDLSIITTNSDILLENIESKNEIYLQTTNDDVTVKNLKANKITIITTNDNIKLTNLDADEINLSSTNGSIKGSVNGNITDYKIFAKTTNDANNLINTTTGAKSLTVKTTNGKIQIFFN